MEEGEGSRVPQVAHGLLGQQEGSTGERAATPRPKYIPKPPKKKRKFTKTVTCRPAKSVTTPQPQEVAVPPPTTEKELSNEQLSRKVRDLVVLNIKYKKEISQHKLDLININVDAIGTQKRLEDANIEQKEGTLNRIKAIESLHAQEIRRLNNQLRDLSIKLADEKKISNTVNNDFFELFFDHHLVPVLINLANTIFVHEC